MTRKQFLQMLLTAPLAAVAVMFGFKTAPKHAITATYHIESATTLKAIHGLDAETELASILSKEIQQEINREIIRTIYKQVNPMLVLA